MRNASQNRTIVVCSTKGESTYVEKTGKTVYEKLLYKALEMSAHKRAIKEAKNTLLILYVIFVDTAF